MIDSNDSTKTYSNSPESVGQSFPVPFTQR